MIDLKRIGLSLAAVTLLIHLIECLKIKELRVPSMVEIGTRDSIFLDCDYEIEDDPELNKGLVIKWFFNDNDLIYQWIPPKNKPQDLKLMRGRLNLNYRPSNDPYKMHRALNLVKINAQLTGKYTCVVSTYLDEVRESKRMVVFDKEDKFQLGYSKHDENTIKVTCLATNLSPRPNLTLYDSNRLILNNHGENVTLNEKTGLFDVSTSVCVNVQQDATFTCELRIPEANYTVRKEMYFSWQLADTTSPPNEFSLQMSDETKSGAYRWRTTMHLFVLPIIVGCFRHHP